MTTSTSPAAIKQARIDQFLGRNNLKLAEAAPWLIAVAGYFVFSDHLALAAQIFIVIIFALSVDLIMGYAGIVTLGHAAFFGLGAYSAGVLAANGWGEPISGLLVAAIVSGLFATLSGWMILRTTGLALLMQTLVIAAMLYELANKAYRVTGGADGLQGMDVWPIFGLFRFDMFGRTAYVYCLALLFLVWVFLRNAVRSSFGSTLTGIRENSRRMEAIGVPVQRRKLVAYSLSGAIAGIAGALLAQTSQFVGLSVLSLDRSGIILVMLIIGGIGRLYGAFIGVPIYMLAHDWFSEIDPTYWYFWVGLIMIAVVRFTRGGIYGAAETLWRRVAGAR